MHFHGKAYREQQRFLKEKDSMIKISKLIIHFGSILFAFGSTPAAAEITANEAISLAESKSELAIATISSMANGMSWMNVELEFSGKGPVYCQPDKLAITDDQYVIILKEHIMRNPRMANSSLGLALLNALKDTFPCKAASTQNR